jgi:transposase
MKKSVKADPSGSNHQYYDEAFKREALELWRGSGRSATAIAAELGIRRNLLYRWARPQGGKKAVEPHRSVEGLEAENRRLRVENAKLWEQREILKKSLGIFSELPPRDMPK